MVPPKQKEDKMKPLKQELKDYQKWLAFLIHEKDKIIPAEQKLPKTSIFYSHYLANCQKEFFEKAAKERAEEDKKKFEDAHSQICEIERDLDVFFSKKNSVGYQSMI